MKQILLTGLMLWSGLLFCLEPPVLSLKDAALSGKFKKTEANALDFDGKTAEAVIAKDTLNHPDDGMTVLAVVKVLNQPDNTSEDKKHDAVVFRYRQFLVGYDYDRFYVNFHNGEKWFAPLLVNVKMSDKEFHSLGLTTKRVQVPSQGEDYLKVKLYFDGFLVLEKNLDHAAVAKRQSDLNIGCGQGFGDVWHFGGEIADISAYNRVLSMDEVQEYTAQFPIIKNQPQHKATLTEQDRALLKQLPEQGTPEEIAAASAIRNLSARTKQFDWQKSAEALLKKEDIRRTGLYQYHAGDMILTVAANNQYAAPASLFDAKVKRELLCWDNPFFRLKMGEKTLSTLDANVKSALKADKDSCRISWTFADAKATVVFRCSGNRIDYTLDAEPGTGKSLDNVEFPALELKAIDPEAALFSPVMSGVENKGAVPAHVSYELEYPRGIASMQFGAYYDNKGGLFWSPADPKARLKKLFYEAGGDRVRIRYNWYPEQKAAFRPECPVQLNLFRGNWYEAAMIYRNMLKEIHALWMPEDDSLPRMDTPSWLEDNTLWFLQGRPEVNALVSYRKIKDYLGLPFGVHLYSWNSKTYDRDYPHHHALPSFLELMDTCHRMGIRVTPYINGRLWERLDRREEDYLYSKLGAANCVVNRQGQLEKNVFNKADFSIICPYTKIYGEKMRESCFLLEGLGADGIYVDQIGAAAHLPCYNPAHGHKIPDDTAWFEKGHLPVFAGIRSEMHARNPETILTTEDNAETCVRNFDGLLCWRWMYDGQVPAFSAVYTGYAQFVGLTYDQKKDAEASFGKAAWQLIGGGQIGWFSKDYFTAPDKHDFRVWVKQLMHLRLIMLPFFNEGKMAQPAVFEKPVAAKKLFWGSHGTGSVTTPAIASTAWEYRNIKAVLLLNTTAQEQTNTVSFHSLADKNTVYVFDSSGKEEKTPDVSGKIRRDFTLPPHAFQLILTVPDICEKTEIVRNARRHFSTITKVPQENDPFVSQTGKPLAVPESLSGMTFVNTSRFECRFFPGCMYPIRFTLPDSTALPEIRWNDRISVNGQEYRLDCDRWAEQKIIENTPEQFVMECTGTFCTEAREYVIPENITAVYRYTFRKNSPEIAVEARVAIPKNGTLELLQLQTVVNHPKLQWNFGEPEQKDNLLIRKGTITVNP